MQLGYIGLGNMGAALARILRVHKMRVYSTEVTLPRFVSGAMQANFTLGLMHKDVRLATELGVASGSPMLVSGLVREIFQTALNEQGAEADVNLLIRLFERQSQVKIVPGAR